MKKTNAIRLLEQKKIAFDTIEYHYEEEDLSLEKIAADNNLVLEKVFKTLVLVGESGVFIALVAGGSSLSLKKMAALTNNKKVELLAVKALLAQTGSIRGACSPLGMKKTFPTYISEEAKLHEKIYINAGFRGLLIGLSPKDLQQLINAFWADIT